MIKLVQKFINKMYETNCGLVVGYRKQRKDNLTKLPKLKFIATDSLFKPGVFPETKKFTFKTKI